MNVTALKRKLDLTPKPAAPVVALPPRRTPRRAAWRKRGKALAAGVLPPLAVLVVLLTIWQVGASGEGSGLPTPVQVWIDSGFLILEPFYV